LFLSRPERAAPWAQVLAEEVPDEDFRIWPETGAIKHIRYAIAWRPPEGALAELPALEAIFSIGAGADYILADPSRPAHVPVVRLIDPALTAQMREYVVMNVLRHHRRLPDYAAQQGQRVWRKLDVPLAEGRRVGIMGLGVLGMAAAEPLAALGFPLSAWCRNPRSWDNGVVHAGPGGLVEFLATTDILVCLLPLTDATRGILDSTAFRSLPEGAAVINAARGALLVERDLVAALESGHLSGATLDVTDAEPLPAESPLWLHPKVTITPHVASLTMAGSAARQIARNIVRAKAGKPMQGVTDATRGY
jgi:glyoxylate/hydroxypyruvate reductase A